MNISQKSLNPLIVSWFYIHEISPTIPSSLQHYVALSPPLFDLTRDGNGNCWTGSRKKPTTSDLFLLATFRVTTNKENPSIPPCTIKRHIKIKILLISTTSFVDVKFSPNKIIVAVDMPERNSFDDRSVSYSESITSINFPGRCLESLTRNS